MSGSSRSSQKSLVSGIDSQDNDYDDQWVSQVAHLKSR